MLLSCHGFWLFPDQLIGGGDGGGDKDMAPSDTNNDYKVHSFLHLHSGFGYNSLGSTCTCHYLIVGSNVFYNGSSSKLNFRFVGSPIVLIDLDRTPDG